MFRPRRARDFRRPELHGRSREDDSAGGTQWSRQNYVVEASARTPAASLGRDSVAGAAFGELEPARVVAPCGAIPQHLEIPFAFRVEEIVSQGRVPYLRRFAGLSTRDREIVEKAMETVDILGFRERAYSDLSGSERQRVKIAIGLAQQPEIMLLDEPTQHLDLGRQIELMGTLRMLNKRGITIVAAMHDLTLVRGNFSWVILLIPGAAAIAGPTAEVLRPELIERAFMVDRSYLSQHFSESSIYDF